MPANPANLSRWWRLVLVAAGLTTAAVAIHGRLPAWSAVEAGLSGADPTWLAVAALLQLTAMAAASGQQQHLLAALRVPMSTTGSLAITYTRAAMSIALPAGSALSTAYAFRQFRSRGADNRTAAAVLVLCGAASLATLLLLYATDLAAWALPRTAGIPTLTCLLTATVAAAAAARRYGRRRPASCQAEPPAQSSRTRLGSAAATVTETLRLTTTITVTRWSLVGSLAALNWTADAGSLYAAARALDLTVSIRDVLTAYLAVQVVRQLPVTPGGIGMVEAGLLVSLTTAGADDARAAAAVLVYRVLSYWAVIPIGLACWTATTSTRRPRPSPLAAVPFPADA